jgi:hypothetical protein
MPLVNEVENSTMYKLILEPTVWVCDYVEVLLAFRVVLVHLDESVMDGRDIRYIVGQVFPIRLNVRNRLKPKGPIVHPGLGLMLL